MANERIIPNRPSPDEYKIPAADKDLIGYVVAFGVPNQKAYALWHPEFLDEAGRLNKVGKGACTQFFSYARNKEYADAYRNTLAGFLNKKGGSRNAAETDTIDDTRKDNALKRLLNQAMSLVEKGEDLDPDTLKVVTEIYKKIGILKDDVEEQEKPRRYLPEHCESCSYRLFVESHVEGGTIVNECDYCRTRRFAEERGWRFDPAKNLDLPQENNNNTDKITENED